MLSGPTPGALFGDGAILATSAAKAALHARTGAAAVDLESAAVAQAAYVNGVPFIAFRSLSDLAGGDPAGNQFPIFVRLAADNSATVVRAFVKALP